MVECGLSRLSIELKTDSEKFSGTDPGRGRLFLSLESSQ